MLSEWFSALLSTRLSSDDTSSTNALVASLVEKDVQKRFWVHGAAQLSARELDTLGLTTKDQVGLLLSLRSRWACGVAAVQIVGQRRVQVELCIKFVAGGYCDLNEPDAWKRTALHYAAEWGRRAPKNRQPTLLSGGDCPCCSAVAFDPQRVPHERSVALTIVNRTLLENGNQILVDFLIGSLQWSTAAAYSRDAVRGLPRCALIVRS